MTDQAGPDDEERAAAGGYHRTDPPPPPAGSSSSAPPPRRPRPRPATPTREDVELGRQRLPEAREALRAAVLRRTTGQSPPAEPESEPAEKGTMEP